MIGKYYIRTITNLWQMYEMQHSHKSNKFFYNNEMNNELRGILTGNNTTTNIYMKLKVKRNRFYKMEKENLDKNAIIYVQ